VDTILKDQVSTNAGQLPAAARRWGTQISVPSEFHRFCPSLCYMRLAISPLQLPCIAELLCWKCIGWWRYENKKTHAALSLGRLKACEIFRLLPFLSSFVAHNISVFIDEAQRAASAPRHGRGGEISTSRRSCGARLW